ncbi:hypothetical protein L1987_87225 [Smallanthus sonchifolius]|nr:hypothetical protein L1987_87225 [Smallanthus sonchifolius]
MEAISHVHHKTLIDTSSCCTTTDKDRPSLSHTSPKHTLSLLSILSYIFNPNSSPNIIHLHLFFHSNNQIEQQSISLYIVYNPTFTHINQSAQSERV